MNPTVPRLEGSDQLTPLGPLLRSWRAERRMSQLELSMRSGLSARHLSFLETGRSQPSRQALAAIAEALDVPLRERNRLFEAAGYAPAYRQTPLASDEMAHIRSLLTFILQRHEPYGAVVLDRYWDIVMSNAAAGHGLRTFSDPSLWDGDRANLL